MNQVRAKELLVGSGTGEMAPTTTKAVFPHLRLRDVAHLFQTHELIATVRSKLLNS